MRVNFDDDKEKSTSNSISIINDLKKKYTKHEKHSPKIMTVCTHTAQTFHRLNFS